MAHAELERSESCVSLVRSNSCTSWPICWSIFQVSDNEALVTCKPLPRSTVTTVAISCFGLTARISPFPSRRMLHCSTAGRPPAWSDSSKKRANINSRLYAVKASVPGFSISPKMLSPSTFSFSVISNSSPLKSDRSLSRLIWTGDRPSLFKRTMTAYRCGRSLDGSAIAPIFALTRGPDRRYAEIDMPTDRIAVARLAQGTISCNSVASLRRNRSEFEQRGMARTPTGNDRDA
jgi:hypothetical protein